MSHLEMSTFRNAVLYAGHALCGAADLHGLVERPGGDARAPPDDGIDGRAMPAIGQQRNMHDPPDRRRRR